MFSILEISVGKYLPTLVGKHHEIHKQSFILLYFILISDHLI